MITGMMLALTGWKTRAGLCWIDFLNLEALNPCFWGGLEPIRSTNHVLFDFEWFWFPEGTCFAHCACHPFSWCVCFNISPGEAVVGMVLWSWWSREVCPLPWYLLLSGLVAWRWPKGPRHTQIVKSHGSCWIFLVPTQALYMSYRVYYIDYLLNDKHICFYWLKPQRSLDSKNRLWSRPVKGSCCLHAMVHSARHEVDSDLIAILTYIMMTLHQPDLTSFWKTYPY